MSETSLDAVIKEVGEIQDHLNVLPGDAFAERYELRRRLDELRAMMRPVPVDFDADRSDADLLAELAGQRARLVEIEHRRIDMVSQSGGSGGSGSGSDGWGGVGINQQIESAAGVSTIKARIGRIKGILIDRGVDIPEGP